MKGRWFWWGLLPLLVLFAVIGDSYSGHGGMSWGLTAVSLALLVLMRLSPLSWFYSFMTIFFVLGCWFKVMVHHITDLPYVEPVGNFRGSPGEWQQYYLFATAIGLGLLAGRLISLAIAPARGRLPAASMPVRPVSGANWLVFVGVASLFYLINNRAAFFVTGVDAKVVLPFALNAPLAFMALIGVAVLLATWVNRDVLARGRLTAGAALAVLVVCSIASVSMASRAAVVMQGIPILLSASMLQLRLGRYRLSKAPLLLFALALPVVLIAVSIYRIKVFSGASGADSEMLGFFLLESALLVFDRWIGAEALMVAVGEPGRSIDLFLRLLHEAPSVGVDSIYQTLSGGKYEFLQGLTFLTLPGYFGVIGLSGEAPLIFALSLLLTLLGLFFEALVSRLLRAQMVPIALVSVAVANALTQLSFPLLLVPFLLQMLILLGVQRAMAGGRRNGSDESALPQDDLTTSSGTATSSS